MKRLGEILSKTANADISEVRSGPGTETRPEVSSCPICKGAGFVRRSLPVDHPRFGKAEPCSCVMNEDEHVRRTRLERMSNLGSLTRFTFQSLVPTGRTGESGWFEEAYKAAREFAEAPSGWLVFSGVSGSGKTHLAAAIANDRISAGEPVLFMVVPDLLDHLRASYEPDDDDIGFDQLFDQVRNTPLLILDDIDTGAGTAWAREKLLQVVNHRYNASLPTVFTTTTRPQQLDERLATRLCDEGLSRVMVLDAEVRGGYAQVGGMTRERIAEHQFRTFDLRVAGLHSEERESLESAFRAAMAYAEDPKGWFVLQGANGCGKTHLAAAIANRVLADGRGVFFAVVPDLLDYLRASFAPGKESPYDELFDRVRNVDLLVLDDLGAQATTQWAQEKLYQVVNYRHVAGLPTVVTTDQSLDRLQEAHPRIVARIADPHAGTVVTLLAPHYRLGRQPDAPPARGNYSRRR
ncbi:MAG: ATP-binding protein [Dehalococcoidia bacterium]|nr:ATP-binding protein [Dehalococcoidia bacterium]